MQPLHLLLSLVVLAGTAQAGGWQGALERVWLWYAYQIDGLKPADQWSLGFRCARLKTMPNGDVVYDTKYKPGLDEKGQCNAPDREWQSCGEYHFGRGTGRLRRCQFSQLQAHVGEVQKKENLFKNTGIDRAERFPDIIRAARAFWDYESKQLKPKDGGATVHNYPPENFLKNSNGEYNHFIDHVGNAVVTSAQFNTNDDNEKLFRGVVEAGDRVVEARIGDHGPFLVAQAQAQDWAKTRAGQTRPDIIIHTTLVASGSNPTDSSKTWVTIDWPATIADSALSPEDTRTKLQAFESAFYSSRTSSDHKDVIMGFRDVASHCRRCADSSDRFKGIDNQL